VICLAHILSHSQVLIREKGSVSLLLFSGVQYYSGQLFDMSAISSLGHRFEAVVGFDLAHAVGNVPLHLHDWGCDFACWCSYKYLNCGPGSIGGCFVHDKHLNDNDGGSESHIDSAPLSSPSSEDKSCKERSSAAATGRVMPRLTGWWGHRLETRFLMNPLFDPCHGANAFRLSNPSVLLVASLRASLDIFDQVYLPPLGLSAPGPHRFAAKCCRESNYHTSMDHFMNFTHICPTCELLWLTCDFCVDRYEECQTEVRAPDRLPRASADHPAPRRG